MEQDVSGLTLGAVTIIFVNHHGVNVSFLSQVFSVFLIICMFGSNIQTTKQTTQSREYMMLKYS